LEFDPVFIGYPLGGPPVGDPQHPHGGPPFHPYGGLPQPSLGVPPFVFPPGPGLVQHEGFPHGATSVTLSLGGSSSPLQSLPHEDVHSSSDLDVTVSFPIQGQVVPSVAVPFPNHQDLVLQAPVILPLAPFPVMQLAPLAPPLPVPL
jgi:hypothetical protein